jgi:hypothetical protein
MAGPLPPAARAQNADLARCPGCGSGDLFTIEIARPQGIAWRGVYCAGEYDRDRRRFLRRSCGYAGVAVEVEPAAGEVRDRTLSVAGQQDVRAS